MNLDKIQSNYYDWLKHKYVIGELQGIHGMVHYIRTPFCNFLGDHFMIYVTQKNGRIILDDDGETINNFLTLDINLFTPQRKLILSNILRKYDVNLIHEDMLSISGEEKDISLLEYKLTLAMIKVDDMHVLIRRNVANMFKDDMYSMLKKRNIDGQPKMPLKGLNGGKYTFDYVSNARDYHSNLINFLNNEVTFDRITTYNYEFNDVSDKYKGNKIFSNFVIYNSKGYRSPNSRVSNIAKSSNIKILPSNDEDKIIKSIS